jgi:hypothetical protein
VTTSLQVSETAFRTVFDVRATGFQPEWWPLYGLVFVGLGLVLLRLGPRPWSRFLGGLAATLAVVWVVAPFAIHFSEYRRLRNALDTGRYILVEGTVEDFVAGRRDSHPPERFRVAGREYVYSPAIVTSGFRRLQVDGGPIRPGLRVRIYDVDGAIARLEIQDAGVSSSPAA